MIRAGGQPGVLVTTDAYPPTSGGSGWSTHALVRALKTAGCRVEVLVFDAYRSGAAEPFQYDGVDGTRHAIGGARGRTRHLRRADYSCAPVQKIVAAYLATRPHIEVVHGQHLHSGQGAVLAARQSGRAALVTLRDYWPVRLDGIAWPDEDEGQSTRWARRALARSFGLPRPLAAAVVNKALARLAARRDALAACHRLICVSEAVRRRVAPALDVPTEVIPNLIDAADSARRAAAAEPVAGLPSAFLFSAGKLNPMKGFDRVVDELADSGCRWPLVVAGTGPESSRMEVAARARGIDLRLLGWTSGAQIMRLASAARAVVVPSAWEEPLARVLLEAMSVGTPCIARATGGSPEAITHGETGFLYRGSDDLRAALQQISDDGTRSRLAAAAARWCASHYAPEVVVERVLDTYRAAREVAG